MECLETFLVRLVYGMCDSLAKSINYSRYGELTGTTGKDWKAKGQS